MFYEYECPQCGRRFDEWQGLHDEHTALCPECRAVATRVYTPARARIDWVNGGYHGDDINLGLGKHFKSTRERDYYAASHGLVKSPEL